MKWQHHSILREYEATQLVNIIHQDKVIHSKMQGQYTNWLYGYICQLAADCVKCVLNKAGRVWHNHDASSFWGHFVVYVMFWLFVTEEEIDGGIS